MSEISTSDPIVVSRQLRRLRRLTIASLCVNGLVLFLILLGVIVHHHHRKHHHSGGGWGHHDSQRGFGHHHHFMDSGERDGSRGDDRMGGSNEDRKAERHGFHDRGGPAFGHQGFGGRDGGSPGPGGFGQRRHGKEMMAGGMPPDPAMMTDGIVAHLTQELTLTDDQKAKVKPIVAAQVAQFQKEAEDRKSDMQKQFADAKAKIKPILNADQQKKLDAMPMPGEKPAGKPGEPDAEPQNP